MIKKMINYKHKMDRIYKLKSPNNVEFKYDINDCIEQLKKIKLTYDRTYVGIVQYSGNVVVSKKIRWRSDCLLGYGKTTLFENEFMFVIDKNEEILPYRKQYYKPFNDNDSIFVYKRLGYPPFTENFINHERNVRQNTYEVSYKCHVQHIKEYKLNHRRR
ncbi:MAG: hypothetical protein E6Q32_08210 [Neisseriales bacterium]|nr:MAG: hypothetical protein E6Q32_08210 [Neisseriales bacterium]